MSKQLGVEMTVLRGEDRKALMYGMVLRRLHEDRPLSQNQLNVGISQDIIEIQKKFKSFSFDSYIGVGVEDCYKEMVDLGLIEDRQGEVSLLARGSKADAFMSALSDDMLDMLDLLPMSTRGFFDALKTTPSKTVTISVDDLLADAEKNNKRVVEDTRHTNPQHGRGGHALS